MTLFIHGSNRHAVPWIFQALVPRAVTLHLRVVYSVLRLTSLSVLYVIGRVLSYEAAAASPPFYPSPGSFSILIFPRPSLVPGCRAPFTLRSFVFLLNFGGAFSPRIESLPRSPPPPLVARFEGPPQLPYKAKHCLERVDIFHARGNVYGRRGDYIIRISPDFAKQIPAGFLPPPLLPACVLTVSESLRETELRDCRVSALCEIERDVLSSSRNVHRLLLTFEHRILKLVTL